MIKVLRKEIGALLDLKARGWELAATVANDKGVLVNGRTSEGDGDGGGDADDPWWHVIDAQRLEPEK